MASHRDSSATPSADDAAVRATVERWADAVRTMDYPEILRHHDPNVLLFDVPPPVQSAGLDAYRRSWDLFFSWSHDPVVFEIDEMTVTAGSDVAFVAAVIRCSGIETNGERVSLTVRLTVGLRKIAGQWMILHEHHSVPSI
jgi:ketosteroid isomerase-like protein